MKPLALVKKHCANYLDDGTCVGVTWKPNGDQFRFLPEGRKCLVACGQRCEHLRWAVLPMEHWDFSGKSEKFPFMPGDGKAFRDAANRYKRIHSGIRNLAEKQRKCPDCGTVIGPQRRYCFDCATERQRLAAKNGMAKHRAKTP